MIEININDGDENGNVITLKRKISEENEKIENMKNSFKKYDMVENSRECHR